MLILLVLVSKHVKVLKGFSTFHQRNCCEEVVQPGHAAMFFLNIAK